jgi:hypothetical protein
MNKIWTKNSLLLILLLIIMGNKLFSQVVEYNDPFYGYVANSDGRIVTTIKEFDDSDEVQIEAMVIGYFHLGTIGVCLMYDPETVFPISGPGGDEITTRLNGQKNMGAYIMVNPQLPNSFFWRQTTTGTINPKISSPWTDIMIGGIYEISDLTLADGEILSVFTLHFKKKEGKLLSNTTFTYYDRMKKPYACNEFTLGSTIFSTGDPGKRLKGNPEKQEVINPEMFVRRSPSKIETGAAFVNGTSVTLTGFATGEGLEKVIGGRGLDWDNIETYGFIYSKNNLTLTINEYSNKIIAEGIAYDFPPVANGSFTLGSNTFYMFTTNNNDQLTHINLQQTIKNLDLEETYYAYAYMTYKFQTSNAYPVLGTQISFIPEACEPHAVALKENAVKEICEENDITVAFLQNLLEMDEGYDYLIFTDEECTEEFTTSIPTDYLTAQTHTFYVIAKNIEAGCTTDLEDALQITIAVNPQPTMVTTSETELYLEENETFYLFVEANYATAYQWYFEGTLIEGATQFCYTDQFNSWKEGVYTVAVSNECNTLYIDFNIYKTINGIGEQKNENNYKLTVYPNPIPYESNVNLLLELPDGEMIDAVAQILDITGKKINEYKITQSLTTLKLNVAEGAYIVKVSTRNNRILITKIIVQ